MTDKFPLHEGLRGRDGGPYLDEVERLREEEKRASREGRPINYNNIRDHADVVPIGDLVDNIYANPGSRDRKIDHRFSVTPNDHSVKFVAPDIEGGESGVINLTGGTTDTDTTETDATTETDKSNFEDLDKLL